jgi:RHS repeat-associated protein
VLGALAAAPAQAATYYELNGPVRLNSGTMSWMGKGSPSLKGAVDVASGAYVLEEPLTTLRGRVPFTMSWLFTSQVNQAGPLGTGTSLSCDWAIAKSTVIAGQPYVLIAPGNRQWVFDTAPNGNGDYINSRDPELLGAVLDITGVPPSLASTLRYKDGRKLFFNAGGNLTRIEDRHANAVTITRDAADKATQVSVNPHRWVSLVYAAPGGKLSQVTATHQFGQTTSQWRWWVTYDGSGRVNTVQGPSQNLLVPSGDLRQYVWTSYNRVWNSQTVTLPLLLEMWYPNGANLMYLAYDTSGRVIQHRVRQNIASNWTASYSAALGSNGFTTVTDPRSNVSRWDYTWNASQYGYRVTSTTDALGRTTTFQRNAAPTNLITKVIDFRGRQISFGWDTSKGNLTSVTLPTTSGGTVTWSATYESNFSQKTSDTDPLGRQTIYTVDGVTGNTTAIRDARNFTTSFVFNAAGDNTSTTNPLNQTMTRTFDPENGDVTSVTDGAGRTTTYLTDIRSLPFRVTDANGKKQETLYNDREQPTTIKRFFGVGNSQWRTTTLLWDGNGNRLAVTAPNGGQTSWLLDPLDRVEREVNPRNQNILFVYDANANVTKRTDRNGWWADYVYGVGDRLASVSFYKGFPNPESTVTLTYNSTTKLLTSIADSAFGTYTLGYDSLDRPTSRSGPNGSVTYTLDNLGRRTGMTVTGQGAITYAFSPTDQITGITQNSLTATLDYDGLGRLTKRTQPNGVFTDWAFDAGGFNTSVISKKGAVTLDSHVYTRDAVGNITAENRNGTVDTFGYNDFYELTSATVGGVNYSYSYDTNGNRTQSIVGGQVTNYTCDTSNCTTAIGGSPVTHDANGNITAWNGETFQWDARGRLKQFQKAGTTITFTYDPFNMRASKTVNGVTTTYLLDGGSVVREVTGGVASDTLHGPAIDQPLARSGKYFTPNQLGSTTTLTNSAGTVVHSYQYGPFGETTGSGSENNPFQYAGRENDGSSLYYNRARYYRPEWGRFISEDPLGITAGLNQYRYGLNNPMRYLDPTGMEEDDLLSGWEKGVINGCTIVGALVGGFGGGVGGGVFGATLGLPTGPGAIGTASAGAVSGSLWGGVKGAAGGAILGTGLVGLGHTIKDLINFARRPDGRNPLTQDTRTAEEIIAKERSGMILREFPSQFLDETPAKIKELADQGNQLAKKAWKLLNDNRFKR